MKRKKKQMPTIPFVIEDNHERPLFRVRDQSSGSDDYVVEVLDATGTVVAQILGIDGTIYIGNSQQIQLMADGTVNFRDANNISRFGFSAIDGTFTLKNAAEDQVVLTYDDVVALLALL